MFKVLEMTDFCIRLSTSLLFGPNNLCSTASSSHDQPPRTSIIMLCCSTVYPLYCCFSSHHTLRFSLRLSVHDYQSKDNSSLASALAWIYDWLYGRRLYLLSLPGSLHTRERPRIRVLRYSRIEASASLGEYLVGNSSASFRSRSSSKNRIFKAALCLERYLFSKDISSAKTWGTLSGNLPYNLQITSLYYYYYYKYYYYYYYYCGSKLHLDAL